MSVVVESWPMLPMSSTVTSLTLLPSKSCGSCHHQMAHIRPRSSLICNGFPSSRASNSKFLLTYKALCGLAPAYLRELLVPYTPASTLRSTENTRLTPPRYWLENFGKISFAAVAPALWNNLPLNNPHLWTFLSLAWWHICSKLRSSCNCVIDECMLFFYSMYKRMCRVFCCYVTCLSTSALVSKGQLYLWPSCLILKLALYKYHIIYSLIIIIIIIYLIKEHPWNTRVNVSHGSNKN